MKCILLQKPTYRTKVNTLHLGTYTSDSTVVRIPPSLIGCLWAPEVADNLPEWPSAEPQRGGVSGWDKTRHTLAPSTGLRALLPLYCVIHETHTTALVSWRGLSMHPFYLQQPTSLLYNLAAPHRTLEMVLPELRFWSWTGLAVTLGPGVLVLTSTPAYADPYLPQPLTLPTAGAPPCHISLCLTLFSPRQQPALGEV